MESILTLNIRIRWPMLITFTANVGGQQVASTTIKRMIAAENVIRTPVRASGGRRLDQPSGAGDILGENPGAEGGLHADKAALPASLGFASLALAYFNYDGLPTSLENIPLEYFDTAIRWLRSQHGVRAESGQA